MGHRKTRRIYDDKLTFENLYEAWRAVAKTCKNRRGVFEFSLFASIRIWLILQELKARRYWPNRFRCFMIFEPKPRLVMSQSIRDKIVNHFVVDNYLLPLLERTLIDTNVATRREKGADCAHKMLKRYIAQMQAKRPGAKIYAVKVDVTKFFYTIDHEKLFKLLGQKIKDPDVLDLVRRIVTETNKPYVNKMVAKFNRQFGTDIPRYERGRGLSIGAVVSQFLAVFCLSEVDRKIKEVYKCRWYVRYMDDLVILGWNPDELKRLMGWIEGDLKRVRLKMNPKSAVYNLCSLTGVPFLGYRYYIDARGRLHVVCLAQTLRRVRRRLKLLKEHDADKYMKAYEAYRGYFMRTWPRRRIEELVGEIAL